MGFCPNYAGLDFVVEARIGGWDPKRAPCSSETASPLSISMNANPDYRFSAFLTNC
jgi:hypothetical protein